MSCSNCSKKQQQCMDLIPVISSWCQEVQRNRKSHYLAALCPWVVILSEAKNQARDCVVVTWNESVDLARGSSDVWLPASQLWFMLHCSGQSKAVCSAAFFSFFASQMHNLIIDIMLTQRCCMCCAIFQLWAAQSLLVCTLRGCNEGFKAVSTALSSLLFIMGI